MSKDLNALQGAVKAASGDIMGKKTLENQSLTEWLSSVSAQVKRGAVIVDADYKTKQSVLWQNLIWRIGKDIISKSNANNLFSVFEKPMPVGGDLQENHIRLKNSLDRTTLSASSLFESYVDIIDVAWHRLNVQEVIPTTYREAEIQKIVSTWDVLTAEIAAIVGNIEDSYNAIMTVKTKQMLYDGYATGQIRNKELDFSAGKNSIAQLLADWDEMQLEPSGDFVGYNLNTKANGVIANRSKAIPYLIITAEAARQLDIYNTLELHFGKTPSTLDNANDIYSRVIKVKDFPNTVSDNTVPDGTAYTPPSPVKTPVAFLVDEDFIHYYKQLDIRTSWRNEMTLNVLVAKHYDVLLSFSPFKPACCYVKA